MGLYDCTIPLPTHIDHGGPLGGALSTMPCHADCMLIDTFAGGFLRRITCRPGLAMDLALRSTFLLLGLFGTIPLENDARMTCIGGSGPFGDLSLYPMHHRMHAAHTYRPSILCHPF